LISEADSALYKMDLAASIGSLEILDHVSVPVACVSAAPAFPLLHLNRAFSDAFGYQGNELQTQPDWAEILDPDGLGLPLFVSRQTTDDQARQIHYHGFCIRCRDGSRRNVTARSSLFRNMLLLTFSDANPPQGIDNKRVEREQHFRRFVENANDIIFATDLQGLFTYLSPNYSKTFGVDTDKLLGQHFVEVLHPADQAACLTAYESVLQGNRLTGIEYRVLHGDGSWSWQASNLGPILDESGQVTSAVGVGRDINLRKQAEEKLRVSEARYRLLSENARDVIWTIAPNGTITYVSPSVERTRGYTPDEAMQQSLDQILTADSMAINTAYFNEMLGDLAAGRTPVPFHGQMEYLCKDGSTYWCEVLATPILAEDGSLVELLGVSRDISVHKRYEGELRIAKEAAEVLNLALEDANERLNRLATTDSLTGLWNRRYFEERVTHEMSVSSRYGQPVSLLLFDIDHFKKINDAHGHLVGDHVLKVLALLVREQIRTTDMPCRWGGEEFMILMPNSGPEEALLVAEKLRMAFANKQIPVAGAVTASFGVATYRSDETLDCWINRADGALYAAKTAGRNTVRLAPANNLSA